MNATAARRETTTNDRATAAPAEDVAPSTNGGNGRDSRGRFTAGNGGGPGNPFARLTAKLRSALIQRVTIEDMNVIADELILQARCGKLEAIKLLLQYVIGKSTDAVNPDTLDVEEFQQVYAPRKEIFESVAEVSNALPPRACSVFVDVGNELRQKQVAKLFEMPAEEADAVLRDPEALARWGMGEMADGVMSVSRPVDIAESSVQRARNVSGRTPGGDNGGGPPSPKRYNGPVAGEQDPVSGLAANAKVGIHRARNLNSGGGASMLPSTDGRA